MDLKGVVMVLRVTSFAKSRRRYGHKGCRYGLKGD